MKKMFFLICIFAISGVTYAKSHGHAHHASHSTGGYYIGYEIGDNDWDSGVTDVSGATLDEDDTGWAIVAGYHYSDGLDIEFGYADFGEASLSGSSGNTFKYEGTSYTFNATAAISLEGDAFLIGIKPKMSISDTVDVFARAGVNIWDTKIKISNGTASADVKDDGNDLYYGFGLSGTFGNFNLSYSHTNYEFDSDDVDSNAFAINYKLQF